MQNRKNTEDKPRKSRKGEPEEPPKVQPRQPNKKQIEIEICRNCKNHNQCTWHDEDKYKKMYLEVKAQIELLVPGVTVTERIENPIKIGAFEIYHFQKTLFSKRKSTLWPNPKAVAQRVQVYFEDLASGKDVSHYGEGGEVKYNPPKKVPFSQTGRTHYHLTSDFRGTKNRDDVKSPNSHMQQSHRADDSEQGQEQSESEPKNNHRLSLSPNKYEEFEHEDAPAPVKSTPEKKTDEQKSRHEEKKSPSPKREPSPQKRQDSPEPKIQEEFVEEKAKAEEKSPEKAKKAEHNKSPSPQRQSEKKLDPPKTEEKKPEPPKKEEKKPEPPKEEKKPEPPKQEEKKLEPPKEHKKPEEKKPDPPKQDEKKPEPPKHEEKKPEPPKDELKPVEVTPKKDKKEMPQEIKQKDGNQDSVKKLGAQDSPNVTIEH